MRTKILILSAAATVATLALAAQPAFAQDGEHSFTGPRAEVNVGYDSTHYDDGIASTPNKLDGVRVGGTIGYDVAVGDKVTIGGEVGGGYTVSGDVTGTAGTSSYRLTSGRDLDASVRVGYKVAPSTLLFVKGGYANSQFRLRTTIGGVGGNTVTNVHTNEDGWRIGGGVEQMINDHIYAKAEYRYTNYGDDVSRHQALVGLGYRF
jgi:outer membrane immunogenic protein